MGDTKLDNTTHSSVALTVPCGSCGAPFHRFPLTPAFPPCSGPPCLSAVGKTDDPGSGPESLLLAEGMGPRIIQHTFPKLSWRTHTSTLLVRDGDPPGVRPEIGRSDVLAPAEGLVQ